MDTGLLNKKLVGKHAFTAVIRKEGYMIGRADYGIRGYTPIRVDGVSFETYEAAKEYAKEQNGRMGLSEKEAMEIVFNTM